MTEFAPIISTFGPSGLLFVLVVLAARGIWPYFRDTHLPAVAAARTKTADAQERIADLSAAIDLRLTAVDTRITTVESTQTRILDAVAGNSRDLAVLTTIYTRRPATQAEISAALDARR